MCYSLICASTDISGVPGTGKTATVHAVVRELKRMAEQNVRSLPFRFGLEYSSYYDSLVGQGKACHLTLGFGTSFAVIRDCPQLYNICWRTTTRSL